jgi:tRNA A-37 threonylcarbamoyl transferase component Bud32
MIGTMVGSFRVVRKLGEGGMGEVFEAVQEEIEKRAAIKVLHAELSQNEEVATRFLNEAKAVNIIQHPGIVSVYDYGRLPTGAAFIIMEFLEGESLARRMQQRQPTSEILRIGRQLASTLTAAHHKGIVHRDLKPDNVMLVPDPDVVGGERAKILDFGIAKVKDARAAATAFETRDGLVLGTPAYMAPEQCRGAKNVDDRADVYSLGVMLYELTCGKLPFVSDEPGTLMAMQIYEKPAPITLPPSQMQTVPPGLVRLIERMMAKDAAARLAMAGVVAELEGLGAATSGASLPPPSARPARARASVWVIGGAALVIVGALAALVALRRPARAPLAGGATTATATPRAEPGEPAASADDAGCMVGRVCAVPSPAGTTTLLALGGAGDRLFAVGYAGTILGRAHGRWTAMASPVAHTLRGLWAASERDAWAVGDQGSVIHFDGTSWSEELSATASTLNAICGRSAGEVWAVGQLGTVVRRRDGRWLSVDSHTVRGLEGIFCGDGDPLWIVGEGGTVLRRDGERLVAVVSGTTRGLRAVGGNGADELFAVGDAGTLLRWDGRAWASLPSATPRALAAVVGSGRGHAWAAGDYGALVRADGAVATIVGSGTTEPLTGIASDAQGLWIIGQEGTLLRYRR